jgi:hypothetical protein
MRGVGVAISIGDLAISGESAPQVIMDEVASQQSLASDTSLPRNAEGQLCDMYGTAWRFALNRDYIFIISAGEDTVFCEARRPSLDDLVMSVRRRHQSEAEGANALDRERGQSEDRE